MEAPEKIWASCDSWSATWGSLDSGPEKMKNVEYTRSDLCTPPACKHGTRWPHECRDCFDEAFPGKASTMPGELAEWLEEATNAIPNALYPPRSNEMLLRYLRAWHEGKNT